MTGEVTFRAASTQSSDAPAAVTTKKGPDSTVSTSEIAVPHLDYERSNSRPYSADYFNLGDTWNDPSGGFYDEVSTIEGYFKDKIESGDMANSTDAVKERMKEILKITNMSKEERNLIKIETVAAYIKFLKESDGIRHNVRRYASA